MDETLVHNPDLINTYADGATPFGLAQLHTLYDFLTRRKNAAEALTDAYLKQITILQKELSKLREEPRDHSHAPAGEGRTRGEDHPKTQRGQTGPKPPKTGGSIIDIKL